jgi:hypothetical protein
VSALRWLGLLVGVLLLLDAFARFRGARVSRVDFAMRVLLAGGLMTVSAFPSSVDRLRDMLMLEREQFSRLIAILIASNLLLWLVLLATRSRGDRQADQFDALVRALGLSEFRRLHPDRDPLPDLVVVLPAFDEAENIGAVLDAMPEAACGLPLLPLVIDDGSDDDTADVARRHGALVVRTPVRRGGGAALRLGFDIALAHGARVVVTMDADGQHLPGEIEALVRPVVEGHAAFVIGSRILGRHESGSRLRSAGIHVFNLVIRLLTPVRVTDCSNGFRALRTAELSRLQLRQDQFHTAELIIDAAKRGFAIAEVPVTVRRRASGESKKGRDWSYGLSFARTVLKTWWRY